MIGPALQLDGDFMGDVARPSLPCVERDNTDRCTGLTACPGELLLDRLVRIRSCGTRGAYG
jgi:hypothetical protein